MSPGSNVAPLSWILENRKILEGVLAIRDFGREEHYLADDETPWSANMAVRTELFKNNPFDPSQGATEDGGYLGIK